MDETAANNKRLQFGNRYLTNKEKVFEHNAWDNVQWSEEQLDAARLKVAEVAATKADQETRAHFEIEAANYWNKFYDIHTNRFFKDRNWLFVEFPELLPVSQPTKTTDTEDFVTTRDFPGKDGAFRIFEVGCGVGNTILPILDTNKNPGLYVYGSDFSSKAVDVLRSHEKFDSARCTVFICDATADDWQTPFPEGSVDIIIYIFVLSAICPEKFAHVVKQSWNYLKPGGLVLFRDYGRYDMAQLRFKKGRCLDDNFYVRGDGTRCYFFTQEELSQLFTSAGFLEELNYIDRRLQVNRGKQLEMYRIWIQCKFRKPK
ncbi:methyltransferase-like protein 2-A isoform X2 [Varroa jacobsoni]|uniref:methyltransferase-like protein 2-A isoform X2 n=1 Tax=Varroa jacobsoni TaxID=62625 RepID=UPI000BF8974B|nr:methyltransferase-like protein 2-A isoform X2 [Varroa jacobsoni]